MECMKFFIFMIFMPFYIPAARECVWESHIRMPLSIDSENWFLCSALNRQVHKCALPMFNWLLIFEPKSFHSRNRRKIKFYDSLNMRKGNFFISMMFNRLKRVESILGDAEEDAMGKTRSWLVRKYLKCHSWCGMLSEINWD